MSEPLDDEVFKICSRTEWEEACRSGVYTGSADDLRDGFIHLSRKDQIPRTLLIHFAGHHDLVLITLEAAAFGDSLRYERSRGGELFPHLYGQIATALARRVEALP